MPVQAGRAVLVASVLAATLFLGACIFRSIDVESLPTEDAGPAQVIVEHPVKAHLSDGSTVLYPNGVIIGNDSVRGTGTRWDLSFTESSAVHTVPLDSVFALESFSTNVDEAATIGVSVLATAAVVAAASAAAVAVFGSCPTFYSDSATGHTLEAEGFSYAIAPLLEIRDVDRLQTNVAADGRIRLEVRNEALETHYLNHLELLEIRHADGEFALPDGLQRPVAVGGLSALTEVRDRDGRDVSEVLVGSDGDVFQTSQDRLTHVTRSDFADWLDIRLPVAEGVDSLALVFRMRNSLLTTVLLYDLMLGDRGAHALNWLSGDLSNPISVIELAYWAVQHLGLRVSAPDTDGWRVVGRVGDAGPIAWKDVVIIIPVTERPYQRVRVEFIADNWRIDRLAYANDWRRLEVRRVPLSDAIDPNGKSVPEFVDLLGFPDEAYVRTSMGESFTAVFEPEPVNDAVTRTFFLASQGWYSEWIRRDWLERGNEHTAFRPDTASLLDALGRWQVHKDSMEVAFFATRIPVR